MDIPFNQPTFVPEIPSCLSECLQTQHLSGNGRFTQLCESILQANTGTPTLLVNSATAALEMAALVLDVDSRDEVIVPSYTFVSTANAFALRGARIRFADVDDCGNLKLSEVARLLTPKTKAVVVVHYMGNSTDMHELLTLCAETGTSLVEDAAHAIGATFRGKALGTFGRLGCFSFHETKNLTAGEGGALLLGDEDLIPRAKTTRDKGTDRARFLEGLTDRYSWVGLGSSYSLSDLNAAYLYPQLLALAAINEHRLKLWKRYHEALAGAFRRIDCRIITPPSHNDRPNGHLFAVVFAHGEQRSRFISYMREHQIQCPFHYVALHRSPFAARFGNREDLPQTDKLSTCLVRLPIFHNLSESMQTYVIENVLAWIAKQ